MHVNISDMHAGRAPPSASALTELQLCLPALHVVALQLLQQLLHAGAALLPHYAVIARLLLGMLNQVTAAGASLAVHVRQQVRISITGCWFEVQMMM